jgi:hypothetical protein
MGVVSKHLVRSEIGRSQAKAKRYLFYDPRPSQAGKKKYFGPGFLLTTKNLPFSSKLGDGFTKLGIEIAK